MTQDNEGLLLKKIQKAFQLLDLCVNQWEATLSESSSLVYSIGNLREQHSNCKEADVENLPITKQFPDVHERLLFKISSEIDVKLASLTEKLNMVKESQDNFTRQEEQCIRMYKRHSNVLDVHKMTAPRTVWPSLAEMLDMLTTADSLLFDLYHCKFAWIQSLSRDSGDDSEGLSKQWSREDKDIIQSIKDQLCHVSIFLTEKL